MNVNRMLRLREDNLLATVQAFLTSLWETGNLDAMLVPLHNSDGSGVEASEIHDIHELVGVDPYDPEMLSNAASMVPEFLSNHKNQKLAVVLRPCELRTLVELQKRGRVSWQPPQAGSASGWLLVIGVDCATQPRLACQICDSPIPHNADLTIGTLGMHEFKSELLIIARDEKIDDMFRLKYLCNRAAFEEEIVTREDAAGMIVHNNARHLKELYHQGDGQFDDLSNLLAFFSRCTLCTDCLDACPLYEGELAGMLGVSGARQREAPLLSELVGVSRWLATCSGCGMCQQACTNGVALMPIIACLSHRIREKIHYVPGEQSQSLPWRTASPRQEEKLHVIP